MLKNLNAKSHYSYRHIAHFFVNLQLQKSSVILWLSTNEIGLVP